MHRRLVIPLALIVSSGIAVVLGIIVNAASASLIPEQLNPPILVILTMSFAISAVGVALLQLLDTAMASRRSKRKQKQLLQVNLDSYLRETLSPLEINTTKASMIHFLGSPARRAAGELDEYIHSIASDLHQETILQGYFDFILELMLLKETAESQWEEKVRQMVQARTRVVIHRLEPERKGILVQFIYESGLIDKDKPLIDLRKANLSKVNLSGISLSRASFTMADLVKANLSKAHLESADLSQADLRGAHLRETNLKGADLSWAFLNTANLGAAHLDGALLRGANLSEAHLQSADLSGAKLNGVNLSGADLHGAILVETMLSEADLSHAKLLGAKVTPEQLKEAKSLEGAIMPDGSTHH